MMREPQPGNEGSWLEDFEIGVWLDTVEDICLRAGNLKRRLEKDNNRVIRMLSNLEQDGTLLKIRNLWKLEPEEDPHLEEELGGAASTCWQAEHKWRGEE